MQDQKNARRIPLGLIAGISAALVAAGAGTAWWVSNSNSKQSSTTTAPVPTASESPIAPVPTVSVSPTTGASLPTPSESPTTTTPIPGTTGTTPIDVPGSTAQVPSKSVPASTEKTVKVYWVNNVNDKVEVVPSSLALKDVNKPNELLEGAFKQLLAGPIDPAVATTIPRGTKLRKVSVEQDGVHVDLSQEFTEGGGSTSMTGRIAQVVYTASSLNPGAKVWIDVEGKPLEVLGGEGLVIDQPMTRESFEQNFNL